jgi:hypothetical protein
VSAAEACRIDTLAEKGDALRVKDQPLIKEKNVLPAVKKN